MGLNGTNSSSNLSSLSGCIAGTNLPQKFPLEYQVTATTMHVLIFIIGFCGNIAVVIVVKKSKSMHTPTYCYLVSHNFLTFIGTLRKRMKKEAVRGRCHNHSTCNYRGWFGQSLKVLQNGNSHAETFLPELPPRLNAPPRLLGLMMYNNRSKGAFCTQLMSYYSRSWQESLL